MPRAVPEDVARRRRERLAELFQALGATRGARVTQREFAASIGREQGTLAAILGGHRALGGDVLMAIVQSYRLPADYFDCPIRPDPRPYLKAVPGVVGPPPALRRLRGEYDPRFPELAEALEALRPDRAVVMALEHLAGKGARHAPDAWARFAIAAQSAHERGVLMDWLDGTLEAVARPPETGGDGGAKRGRGARKDTAGRHRATRAKARKTTRSR